MTEPSPAELNTLTTRLHQGVPAAPRLAHLAPRVQLRARRARRGRRAGAIVAAALAVVAAVGVPRMLGQVHPPAPTNPQPPPAACVQQTALDHQDFRAGTAVWVLACGGPLPRYDMALPSGPIRGGAAAALVSSWQRIAYGGAGFASCPPPSWPGVTVQVGFADGTVSEVEVNSCQGLISPGNQRINASPPDFADEIARDIEHQHDAHFRRYDPPGPPRECPRTLADPAAMNLDGASAKLLDDSGSLLDLTAVESLVCRYDSGHLTATRRDLAPEGLLLSSGSGWLLPTPGNRADLRHIPLIHARDGAYLVSLRDKTDAWRTFTVTGRYGAVTLYRGHGATDVLGYAAEPMLTALGVTRR